MTKKELIEKIATEANISKAAAGRVLHAFMETVTESLARRDRINLIGFGTFCVKDRAARKCCNPRTGEAMVIPARTVATFRPGKELAGQVEQRS